MNSNLTAATKVESLVSKNCIHQGEMCSAIFIDNKKIVLKFLFGCVSNSSNIRLQLLLNMEQILKYIHLSLQPTSQILTIKIWYIYSIIFSFTAQWHNSCGWWYLRLLKTYWSSESGRGESSRLRQPAPVPLTEGYRTWYIAAMGVTFFYKKRWRHCKVLYV